MKPYPSKTLELEDGTKVTVPDQVNMQNFEDYMDEQEWVFYHSLPDATRLSICLCVNPFNAFMDIYNNCH